MGARDTGWIQIYAENNQEAYDNFIQAYPIAESAGVHLPIMICQDGFITSHAVENIELLEDEEVKNFVGEYEPEEFLLNPGKPIAVGPYSVTSYAMEAKEKSGDCIRKCERCSLKGCKEFKKISGRSYGLFEEYKTKDADYIMLLIGSAAGTAKQAVDDLRAKGKKSVSSNCVCSVHSQPDELATALKGAKAVAIMDRTESYNGNGGPLGSEVTAGLFRNKVMIDTVNYIYGLAGRDFTVQEVYDIFADLEDHIENGTKLEQFKYIGLR